MLAWVLNLGFAAGLTGASTVNRHVWKIRQLEWRPRIRGATAKRLRRAKRTYTSDK